MADDAAFVEVGDTDAMADGEMRQVRVAGSRVLLGRVDGRFHAIGGVCTHEEGTLADGEMDGAMDGDLVTCPVHFGQFNVRTREAVAPPCDLPEPVHDVKVEGGRVLVARQPRA